MRNINYVLRGKRQNMVKIRKGSIKDIDIAVDIGKKLPDFFTPYAFSQMKQDFKIDELYIIEKDMRALGFCSIKIKNNSVAEITWLGILPFEQKKGIGTKLIEFVQTELKSKAIKILKVKTLDESANYEPYERTRKFYEKCDFLHIDTIDPFPGWEPGNPCAIYVKIL